MINGIRDIESIEDGSRQILSEDSRLIENQRNALILFLAAELYSYEWIKENFPDFYQHCEGTL